MSPWRALGQLYLYHVNIPLKFIFIKSCGRNFNTVKGVQVNTAPNVTVTITRRLVCLSPVPHFIAAKHWCRSVPGVTSERMRPPDVTPLRRWQEILRVYPSVRRYAVYLDTLLQFLGARGGAVGLGTALQVGRLRVRFPMVSLEFFIDIILPAALWSWGQPSL